MIQTLIKNWWLLALSGVADAILAVTYLIIQDPGRPLTFQAWRSAAAFLGWLAMAAGVCTIAAGIWRSASGKCWHLVLNGLALCAFGVLTELGVAGSRISFRSFALLIIVMAMSLGALEWMAGRRLNAAVSIGFVAAFLALAFRWITVEPGSHADLLWLGAYFGFSAICKVRMAFGTLVRYGRDQVVRPVRGIRRASKRQRDGRLSRSL